MQIPIVNLDVINLYIYIRSRGEKRRKKIDCTKKSSKYELKVSKYYLVL